MDNQVKNNRPAEEFLSDNPELLRKIKPKAKVLLKDVAFESTRKIFFAGTEAIRPS